MKTVFSRQSTPTTKKKKVKRTQVFDTQVDQVDEPIVRKRKAEKVSSELVVATKGEITNKKVRTIEKFMALSEQVKGASSVFGLRQDELLDALANKDVDHVINMFQEQAFATIVTLIPMAEAAYKKEKREHQMYALNAIISQGRELAADIAAMNNKKQLAQMLVDEVLNPAFKSILQHMLNEQLTLKALLADKIIPGKQQQVVQEIDTSLRNNATSMTQIYDALAQEIKLKLIG